MRKWVCARLWPATRTDGGDVGCRGGERARRRASDQTGFDRRWSIRMGLIWADWLYGVWYSMRDDDEMSWRWRRSAGPSPRSRSRCRSRCRHLPCLFAGGWDAVPRAKYKCLLPIRDAPGKLEEVN